MLIEKTGDILTTTAAAVAHGCNCRGSMDAGLAAQIRKRYPKAFARYRAACAAGTFRPGTAQLVDTRPHRIWNLATQDAAGLPLWRGGAVWANAAWIEECLLKVAGLAIEHSLAAVAFPRVGCDLGGLFWDAADFADKRHQFGAAVGAPPVEDEYVSNVFLRVFGSASMTAEVWTHTEPARRWGGWTRAALALRLW